MTPGANTRAGRGSSATADVRETAGQRDGGKPRRVDRPSRAGGARRVSKRQPGARKREREILDGAARIFQRNGYANTSVQEIADSVGLLKGSLYYYIDSKEDLLFRVLVEVHDRARTIVEDVGALDDSPLTRLRRYVQRHIEYNASNLTQIAVYNHDSKLLSPERRAVILEQRRFYQSFLRGLIEEAQASGEIDRSLSPRLLTNGILGVINWTYTWYRPRGSVTPQQLGEIYGALVTDGLLAGDPAIAVGAGPGQHR